ncbi:hypothetical protein [Falsigemmobacter faecalis]|uniref:Heat-shock protein n=1 Tax=Falsigemmobacter faecalis TaxID=2488730 RepID=A0A3P3D1I6_9RHOB|nr:hypothetical protein [Falsigemmobacter faecalis]RRH68325.1 hypothetical protein EG244_19570 [Falsigemmobacter faecalis]
MAYWPPFYHDNLPVDLSHLEPFDLTVTTPSGAQRGVHVTFSPHTFTRGIETGDPKAQECFDQRVFCSERYELSKALVQIITTWPDRRVLQTWERRSWVYLAIVELGVEGGPYHVFFSLKRRQKPARVDLFIESAYRKDPSSYTPPSRPSPIRFALLVEKVFQGQPLRFK